LFDCFWLAPEFIGDEGAFLLDLKYFINHSYSDSIIHGISIPYTIISYFFYLFTDNISISLRITGILFTLLFILYMIFRSEITLNNYKLFFFYLLLLIGTTGGMLYGTNDSIFLCSYIIFIIELLFVNDKGRLNCFILFISSFLFIISRPVCIIYGTIFLLGFIFYKIIRWELKYPKQKDINRVLYPIILSILFICISNYPRLMDGIYYPSYSNKIWMIEESRGVTWAEWVYYSQLVGNETNFGFFSNFVDVKEVIGYKKQNGESNLPTTFSEYLIHDISFIIRRAITSIFEILLFSIRYVGIYLFLLPVYVLCKNKTVFTDKNIFIISIIFSGILVWAVIWPGLVQHRWLFPFYVLLLFLFTNEKSISIQKYHFVNILLLDLITIWALWKEKLFYYL
jgi:hypothetical protein